MFEDARAYEQVMGRWSKLLAPLFVEFVGVHGEVLDVGCGTGSLTFAAAENKDVSRIVGLDPSTGFIEYARSRNVDPRVTFEVGDAQHLPFPDVSFDRCLSSLIVSFISDAPQAVREMRRVTRRGGIIATCMWDNHGGMELFQVIWNAAIALDPGAEQYRAKQYPFGSPDELSNLWVGGGLQNIALRELVIPLKLNSFDDLWRPSVKSQGPMGAYLAGLPPKNQEILRTGVQHNILGDGPDRPFTLKAKAWAIRGTPS
jgi:SAM-dependent methyltransferase